MHTFRTVQHSTIQIDLGAIDHNCDIIRQHIGEKCGLCAVTKADGYGLGSVRVASRLRTHADMLCVYSLDEAGELLASGVAKPILILAPVHSVDRFHPVYRGLSSGLVHFAVHGSDHMRSLATLANRFGTFIQVHVKIDTGLHRGGCELSEARDLIEQILMQSRLKLTGVMTHFVSAVDDEALTRLQHDRFDQVLHSISNRLPPSCMIHEANTAAMVQWKWTHRNMVRVGLAWTGTVPNGVAPLEGFRPVVSWRSCLAHVRRVGAGERVGYSGKWTAKRSSLIGIVPVGYAVGYPIGVGAEKDREGAYVRIFDDKFHQSFGDAPVIGCVCMDQIAVDLTNIPETVVGCGVELISVDPTSKATLEQIACVANVVPHAIISRISPKVQRTYKTPVPQIHTDADSRLHQCL